MYLCMFVCKQDKRTKRNERRRLQKGNVYLTKEAITQGNLTRRGRGDFERDNLD